MKPKEEPVQRPHLRPSMETMITVLLNQWVPFHFKLSVCIDKVISDPMSCFVDRYGRSVEREMAQTDKPRRARRTRRQRPQMVRLFRGSEVEPRDSPNSAYSEEYFSGLHARCCCWREAMCTALAEKLTTRLR